METVGEIIKRAAETFKERDKDYGEAYKHHGDIMSALFPDGLTLKGSEMFNRYAILNAMIVKLHRYSYAFKKEGTHLDSLHDLGIYSFMLEERDQLIKMGEQK